MHSSHTHAHTWKGASWFLGFLGLAAVAGVVARRGEVERFVRLLDTLSPAWLALGLLLQALTYACVALAWRLGLRQGGVRRPVPELLALAVGKLFVDQSMPLGGIGGTAFVVAALGRRGVPRGACLATLILNLLGQHIAYLLATCAVVGTLWLLHQARPWMLGIAGLFMLASITVPLGLVLALRLGRRIPKGLLRLPGVRSLAKAASEVPTRVLRDRRLPAIVALNLAWIALDAATLWAMLHALGLAVSYPQALPAYLLALMVATITPIPMGLGTFEAACVAALTAQHVPIEGALAATLLLRGYTTWLPMVPGWLVTRRAMREQRTTQTGEGTGRSLAGRRG